MEDYLLINAMMEIRLVVMDVHQHAKLKMGFLVQEGHQLIYRLVFKSVEMEL